MDYEAQQVEEIEALQSIYFEQFEELDVGSKPRRFQVQVGPNALNEENHVIALIKITLPENYPDQLPDIGVFSQKGLTNKDCDDLKANLIEIANGLIGNAMVFSITSAAQDWLLQHNDKLIEEEQAKNQEANDSDEEDAEKLKDNGVNRFTMDKELFGAVNGGTAVTQENFAAWKVQFDERIKKERENRQEKKWPGECSGREYFEKKNIKFMEHALAAAANKEEELNMDDFGEDVDFDESVFLEEEEEVNQ